MHNTYSMILGALLLIAVLFISYALATPAESAPQQAAERAALQEYFSRPIATLPLVSQSAPPAAMSDSMLPQETPEPPASTAAAILVWNAEKQEALFARNASSSRPIASITKLVTAAVTLQHTRLQDEVYISDKAVSQEGDAGELRPGERMSVRGLLHALLLDSSNDAAYALAEHVSSITSSTTPGISTFITQMNAFAQAHGMRASHFADTSGLNDAEGYSSAYDIARLIVYLREDTRYAPVWQILQKQEATVYSTDSQFRHHFVNNNILVQELVASRGGKTGYTQGAGESLALVMLQPDQEGEVVYVLLGSEDRFGEMRRLINWVNNSFAW